MKNTVYGKYKKMDDCCWKLRGNSIMRGEGIKWVF